MKTLYHGTTRENWESIQREGWLGDSHKTVWNCSMREIYFFDMSKADDLLESNILTESKKQDLVDEFHNILINQTFEQAQIAAAVQDFKGTELLVLRFDIPDEFVNDDNSCINTEESSSVDIENMKHSELTGIYVSGNYNPSLRLFYICGLMSDNEYLNMEPFSELEIEAAKIINDAGCYIEDLFCHEWDTELEQVAA